MLLPPLVWVAVGLFPLAWPPAENWLLRVPAAVFLLLAAAGLGGFLWQIRHTLLLAPDGIHMEGGSDYAVG